VQTKAELLAKTGKMKEAIATAEEALALSKQKDPNANTKNLEKMISDWKSKQ
jgi:predicted RNA polymerase sigma factor